MGAFGPVALAYTIAHHAWVALNRRLLGRDPLASSPTSRILQTLPLPSANSNESKVAIVTGSNTGIGFETAKALVVDHGMTVILACRSRDKAERAAQAINDANDDKANQGRAIFLHPLDLSSFSAVREFANKVKEQYSKQKIHVLVNNAGRNTSMESRDKVHGQALDLLFQSNMLGHFLLTAELLDVFAENDNARIVNLSSVMHHFCGGYQVEDVEFWKSCAMHEEEPQNTYSASKLAAILFSIELNRRFSSSNNSSKRRIRSIAVSPGAV